MAVWELQVLEKYYDSIVDGDKTVEARAPELDGDFRYEEIEEGDTLRFFYSEDEDSSVSFEAGGLTYYDSVDELLGEEAWEEIVPEAESKDEVLQEFTDLPGNYGERIEKHGVYAIEIGERLS